MKIGIASIRRKFDTHQAPFAQTYDAVGWNTGNMMFNEAVYRQLDGELSDVGYTFDPATVNEQLDAIVIPAANWLGSHAEWDWFIDRLEKVKIPVVTIGLGAQAKDQSDTAEQWNASSVRLAKVLASKSAYLSVRGNYTLRCLNQIGILNVVATGCPSLYRDFSCDEEMDGGLIVQSTRYMAKLAFAEHASLNRELFRFAYNRGLDMVHQSEPEELEYTLRGREASFLDNQWVVAALVATYGAQSSDAMLKYFDTHCHAFFDLEDWASFVRRHQGVLGTRLHGAILALNAGRPAVLLPHDSRTAELVEFASIPTATLDACDWTSKPLGEIPLVQEQMGSYYERRTANSATYRAFLGANRLPFNAGMIS